MDFLSFWNFRTLSDTFAVFWVFWTFGSFLTLRIHIQFFQYFRPLMNLKLLRSKLKKSFVPRIVFKGFRTLAAKNADCAFDPKPNFCNLLINGANNKLTQALKIIYKYQYFCEWHSHEPNSTYLI